MKMYLCTRPLLAARLQAKGFKAESAVNPWKPKMTAWLFELNEGTAEIIVSYYESIGQKAPAQVREMLDEQ